VTVGQAPSASEAPLDAASASRLPAEAVLGRLGTGSEGLTSVDAADRLRALGANVLLTHRVTALGVLKRQLRNPLLFLLLGAAVISGLTGDPADAVIIAAILALSVGLGFVNEYRSERAAVPCTTTSAIRLR
jgi:Mg2+-importing ATPase